METVVGRFPVPSPRSQHLPANFSQDQGMPPRQPTLMDRIDDVIQASPYLSGRNLRFEAQEGRVTLKGVVNTYFQKQMAQEALRKIDGVTAIDNELEVTWA
jgi:hypothetical protein